MRHSLHIIAFDIPFPANYGGVIVVYYHLKALAQLGVKITLHCFEYGDREAQEQLKEFCDKVYYYPRSLSWTKQMSTTPFIVETRKHSDLLKHLLEDDAPIIMEGLHCCAYLDHPALKDRLKLVRMHNIEWQYYNNLAKLEPRFLWKAYFYLESWKLKRFERKKLKYADAVLTLSSLDQQYFNRFLTKVFPIGPFHGNEAVSSQTGKGNYMLFHGKLSVEDNEQVAIFLISKLMPFVQMKLIIAGMNPSEKLKSLANGKAGVKLIANPAEEEMKELIQQAHINLLLSFQVAGIKLKLLNALYQGRHCLVNDIILKGTDLDSLCEIANTAAEFIEKVKFLEKKAFTAENISQRESLLSKSYANQAAAKRTIQILENREKYRK